MADDLKQRLRAVCETGCDPDLPFEAADRIEQLEAERDDLALIIATDTGTESAVADLQRQLVAVTAERDELRFALENVRLFAARNRKEVWAPLILGFCAEGGVVGSVTR